MPDNYPPPGSPEAIGLLCSCPREENSFGKGVWNGVVRQGDGTPLYKIDPGCPIHAPRKDADPEEERTGP